MARTLVVADADPAAVVELHSVYPDVDGDDADGEPYWAGTCAACGWDLNATGIPHDPVWYPGSIGDAQQAAAVHVDQHPAPGEDQPS